MLEIQDACKYYFGSKAALNHLSFALHPGEITALLGENGAGKTTLFRSILGLQRLSSGKILLDGEPIGPHNLARLSFASSEHTFFGHLTAKQHRDFYKEVFPRFDQTRFELLLDFFQLPSNRPLRGFSTGMKNQFELLLALSQGADYILLDEPFAGSDMFSRSDFYKLLAGMLRPEETVLLATHLVEEVRYLVNRALLLQQGKLIAETTAEELEQQGIELPQWLRQENGYQPGRAARALEKLEEDTK